MIAIGSDHAGFATKEDLKALLKELGQEVHDVGTHSADSADYPEFASAVAEAIHAGKCQTGILICGTGIGMSIAANKHAGIRAAVCESATAARLARAHNDANILCLGARIIGWESPGRLAPRYRAGAVKTAFFGLCLTAGQQVFQVSRWRRPEAAHGRHGQICVPSLKRRLPLLVASCTVTIPGSVKVCRPDGCVTLIAV